MKYETFFNLRQKVKIKELNLIGTISGFFIDNSKEIQYRVRLIKDCESKELYWYEDDLESVNEENKLGFK